MEKYLTPEGLEKLKKDLDESKKIKRKEIAERLKLTASFGDLTENAAYQEAKEEQAFLEGKILELENLIKDAILVKNRPKDRIEIGSTVWLSQGWQKERFRIVGAAEVNSLEGRISNESPLGKTLIGKNKGEVIEVETPGGVTKYKILKIE